MSVTLTVSGTVVEPGKATPLFSILPPGSGSRPFAANSDLTKFVVVETPFAAGQRFQVLPGWT